MREWVGSEDQAEEVIGERGAGGRGWLKGCSWSGRKGVIRFQPPKTLGVCNSNLEKCNVEEETIARRKRVKFERPGSTTGDAQIHDTEFYSRERIVCVCCGPQKALDLYPSFQGKT